MDPSTGHHERADAVATSMLEAFADLAVAFILRVVLLPLLILYVLGKVAMQLVLGATAALSPAARPAGA